MQTAKTQAKQATATVTATATIGSIAPTYTLGAKATALAASQPRFTLQAPIGQKLGNQWRAPGYTAPNTRVAALQAIQAVAPCTTAQAVAALAPLKAANLLGTGTPNSYVKAFVANGYLAPSA